MDNLAKYSDHADGWRADEEAGSSSRGPYEP
jgi:hypothetical protein